MVRAHRGMCGHAWPFCHEISGSTRLDSTRLVCHEIRSPITCPPLRLVRCLVRWSLGGGWAEACLATWGVPDDVVRGPAGRPPERECRNVVGLRPTNSAFGPLPSRIVGVHLLLVQAAHEMRIRVHKLSSVHLCPSAKRRASHHACGKR